MGHSCICPREWLVNRMTREVYPCPRRTIQRTDRLELSEELLNSVQFVPINFGRMQRHLVLHHLDRGITLRFGYFRRRLYVLSRNDYLLITKGNNEPVILCNTLSHTPSIRLCSVFCPNTVINTSYLFKRPFNI